jgi:hypothetical protein
MSVVDMYGGGLFVAVCFVSFFVLFSTALSSLLVPTDLHASMPPWYRALAIPRRARRMVMYYAASCCVFLAMSLSLPLYALLRWDQVGAQAQVAGVVSWIGILVWSAVLLTTVRRVSRP